MEIREKTIQLLNEYLISKGYNPIVEEEKNVIFFTDNSTGLVFVIEIDEWLQNDFEIIEQDEIYILEGILFWHNFDREQYLHSGKFEKIINGNYLSIGWWRSLGFFQKNIIEKIMNVFDSQFDDLIENANEAIAMCEEDNKKIT